MGAKEAGHVPGCYGQVQTVERTEVTEGHDQTLHLDDLPVDRHQRAAHRWTASEQRVPGTQVLGHAMQKPTPQGFCRKKPMRTAVTSGADQRPLEPMVTVAFTGDGELQWGAPQVEGATNRTGVRPGAVLSRSATSRRLPGSPDDEVAALRLS